jgi:hypothetical protein
MVEAVSLPRATLPQVPGGSASTLLPGFLLQRAYHVPAADIGLAAAGTVDDRPAEREMRVVAIASALLAAIAFSRSASKSGRGVPRWLVGRRARVSMTPSQSVNDTNQFQLN